MHRRPLKFRPQWKLLVSEDHRVANAAFTNRVATRNITLRVIPFMVPSYREGLVLGHAMSWKGVRRIVFPRHCPVADASNTRHLWTEDAVRHMVSFWRLALGGVDERLEEVGRLLDARFRRDFRAFSGVFEPSISFDGISWQPVRFSYAFPDFFENLKDAISTILGIARPFGHNLVKHLVKLLRASTRSFVEQPIVGLAYDNERSWNFKFYFQIIPGEHDGALAWLKEAVPLHRFPPPKALEGLYLIGIDLGSGGVTSIKLYVEREGVPVRSLSPRFFNGRVTQVLLANGIETLRNLLFIHRTDSPSGNGLESPSEVDFPLAINGLSSLDLFGPQGVTGLSEEEARPLFSSVKGCDLRPANLDGLWFRVVRLTLSACGRRKVNFYFHPIKG